ncbi:MAG: pyridoxal phosphate-dependent aminotransferase [Deltaproteobacteria bacterium]|nr:pyridoxal phosphate-dependent aminotransferase [Deltaproteobacteria bacterium]
MFSARTRWARSPNAVTLALRQRPEGPALLDLTEANPTRVDLAFPPELSHALLQLSTPMVHTYTPSPFGLDSAREAVAGYYGSRGLAVDPGRVLLTASTSEAYGWLFKLLCDPGDEVLVPQPSYPLFEDLATLEGVRVVPVPHRWTGFRWELDPDELERAVSPRTRAVLVVHPNNPTGALLDGDALGALTSVCARRGLALVCDEVFGDYLLAPRRGAVGSLATHREVLTFTLSGLSKVVCQPQLKLGWVVVSGPEEAVTEALARLELLADCYLSVGAPVMAAAPALLGAREAVQSVVLARLRRNLAALRAALGAGSPWTALPVEAGWYAVLRVPRTRPEEDRVCALVRDEGVLVSPGYFFELPADGYLVLSLLPREEVFDEGLRRALRHAE